MQLKNALPSLQVVADFGIVIGLFLVVLQIRQSEQLERVQILNQYFDSYAAYEASFAGEQLPAIWQKSVLEPANLTLGEMRALEAITFVPVARWVNLYRQSEAGILTSEDWIREVQNDATYYFDTPYARAWWQEFAPAMLKDGYLPVEMYELVERALARSASEAGSPASRYQALKESIAQQGNL